MNQTNEKLNKAREQIKPIYFDSIKFVVLKIRETHIPADQRLKILPSNNHEILTVFQGGISCKIGEKTLITKEKDKDILFLPNNQTIVCTPKEDTIIFRIQILIDSTDSSTAMSSIQQEINTRISESGFRFMGHWKLCRLFEKIKTEISNSYPFSELKISLLIQDFILTFLRIYLTELKLKSTSNSNKDLMNSIQAYIETTLNKKISLKNLAKESKRSTRQTARIIKKSTELTPTQYIQTIKMEYAKKELLLRHKTIKEIASNLGYQDISYFYRCFKKQFGTTPNKMRNDI